MKKTQRSFAVEYKGRRKPDPKSNSIWGGIDLKSVARDVEEEAVPYAPGNQSDGRSAGDVLASKAEAVEPFLTEPVRQHTTGATNEETTMADESETMTTVDAPAVVDTPTPAKKQRRPRAKKVAAEAASAGTASETAVVSNDTAGKQKRGRKAKVVEAVVPAKPKPVKRIPKPVKKTPAVSKATDDISDLLQLEEENQKLRKLLAEKLRTENADLRKRLKLD